MEPKDYIVSKIESEYAYLHDLSGTCDEDIFIALALLPAGTDLGSRIHCEMFEYTLAE